MAAQAEGNNVIVPVETVRVVDRDKFETLSTDDVCSCIAVTITAGDKVVMMHVDPWTAQYYGGPQEYVDSFFKRMELQGVDIWEAPKWHWREVSSQRPKIPPEVDTLDKKFDKDCSGVLVDLIEEEMRKRGAVIVFRDLFDDFDWMRQVTLDNKLSLKVDTHKSKIDRTDIRRTDGEPRYAYNFNNGVSQDFRPARDRNTAR